MAFLTDRQELGGTTILLLDDAQELSDEVLEGVYKLTLIEKQGEKLLQVILSGRPELETRLEAPRAHPIGRAVSDYCHLSRLELRQVSRYIKHRVRNGGYEGPELFQPEAVELIAELSNGVPRAINRLCGEALELANRDDGLPVDIDSVERAQALLESGLDPNRVDGSAAQDLMFARNGAVPDWLREGQMIDNNEEENQSDSSPDALQSINLATLEAAITEAAAMESKDTGAPPPEADPGALADSLDGEANGDRQRLQDTQSQGSRPLRASPFEDWSIPIPDDDDQFDDDEEPDTPKGRRTADLAVTPSPDGLSIPPAAAIEIGNARRWAKRARLAAGFAVGIVFGAGVVAFFQWERVTPIDDFPDWLKMAARDSDPVVAPPPSVPKPPREAIAPEPAPSAKSNALGKVAEVGEAVPEGSLSTDQQITSPKPPLESDDEAAAEASAQFIEDLVDPKNLAPDTEVSQADRSLVSLGTIEPASLETPIPPAPKVELPEPPIEQSKPRVRELPPSLAAELEATKRGGNEPLGTEDDGSMAGSDFLAESTSAKSLAKAGGNTAAASDATIAPQASAEAMAEAEKAPSADQPQVSESAKPGPVDLAAQALKDTAEAVKAAVAALAPAAKESDLDPEEASDRTTHESDHQAAVKNTTRTPDARTPPAEQTEKATASEADQQTTSKARKEPQDSTAEPSSDLVMVPTIVDNSRQRPGIADSLTEKPPALSLVVDNPFADSHATAAGPATAEVPAARDRAGRRAMAPAKTSGEGAFSSQDKSAAELVSGLTRRPSTPAPAKVMPLDERAGQSTTTQSTDSEPSPTKDPAKSQTAQTGDAIDVERGRPTSGGATEVAEKESIAANESESPARHARGSKDKIGGESDLVAADILTGDERIIHDQAAGFETAPAAEADLAEPAPFAPVPENVESTPSRKALADKEPQTETDLAEASGNTVKLPPPLPMPPSPPAALALLLPSSPAETLEEAHDKAVRDILAEPPFPSVSLPKKVPVAKDVETSLTVASAQGESKTRGGPSSPLRKDPELHDSLKSNEGVRGPNDSSSKDTEMTAASRSETPGSAIPSRTRAEPQETAVQVADGSGLTSTIAITPEPKSADLEISPSNPTSTATETADPKLLLKDTEGKLTPAEDMPVPATLGPQEGQKEVPPEVEELPILALEKSDLTAKEPALAAVDSNRFGNDVDADPAIHRLLMRGQTLVRQGDMASARLFFQLAAKKGSARAATATAMTYDPVYHQLLGIVGAPADPIKAIQWYERAIERGDSLAYNRLEELDAWLKLGPPETEKE